MSRFTLARIIATAVVVSLVCVPSWALASRSSKIINGGAVKPDRQAQMWAHLVSIGGAADTAVDAHQCGGSLISTRLVLTAAHCVVEYGTEDEGNANIVLFAEPRSMSILAGAATLSSEKQAQRRRVTDIFVHPKWNPRTDLNDIAVLRLGTPVTENAAVRVTHVVTPEEDAWWGNGAGLEPSAERGPWAAGWGNTKAWSKGSFFPDNLREVLLRVASDDACTADDPPGLGDYDGGVNIAQYLCAGIPDSDANPNNGTTGFDTCQGDSGGPLMAGDGAGAWSVFAVVSSGDECGGRYYGAYTRLSSYRSWIASIDPVVNGPGGIAPVPAVKVMSRGYASAAIRWAAAPGAKSYAVYVDYGESGMRRAGTTRARKATIRGLEYGYPYDVYVAARNAAGNESPMRRIVVRAGS